MENVIEYPIGNVLLRKLNSPLPVISYGKGIYLFDKNGKKYIDAVAGALVVSVGHGNEEVIEYIKSEISKVSYVNGTQFTCESTENLANLLAELARGLKLTRSFFLCSGSEAIEAAIKFARQLWFERGETERTKIIARQPSYHGNTLYALSASGRPHYKKCFGPLLHDVITVSSPSSYRFPSKNYEQEGADYYAKELEVVIKREGAKNIIAFLIEPLSGSSTGAIIPPPNYFEKIQNVCNKYGILIIADEVMVGSGRTGSFFASDKFGLKPDILVLGKGIGGGYAPLSAVMVKEEHVEEMKRGLGQFMHAQTFMNAPCMTAAGVAVLNYMKKHKVIENVSLVGEIFQKKLYESFSSFEWVGNISGTGLIAGIEFVANKETKTPFPRSEKISEKIISHALNYGITLWPNVGHVDGVNGDLILVGPPLIITEDEVNDLVEKLRQCITDFFQK